MIKQTLGLWIVSEGQKESLFRSNDFEPPSTRLKIEWQQGKYEEKKDMKSAKLAIFATLLTMASTTFAVNSASPGTSIAPTMEISATVQTAIRLTLAASTGCSFSAPTGGQDYAMNFGTVDALGINNGSCPVGAGSGHYNPTNPGVSDDTIYYSNYTLTPQFASQAQSTGTLSAYVSTNFTATDSLTIVHGGTSAALPAQAAFTAMGVGSANATNIATSVVSGTALTRWIGVEVAHTNASTVTGVGTSQSATVTYTLTIP